MKVYVATSWRNASQPSVVARLRAAGHDVYDFRNPMPGVPGFSWDAVSASWRSWAAADIVTCYEHPAAKRGLALDFEAMQRCDALVMLQPCGRSAHLELGWAIGAGKLTIVLMEDGQDPDLMIRLADVLCLSAEEVIAHLASFQADLDSDCEGDGCCHGAMKWCARCGDVSRTCDDRMCCVHSALDEQEGVS